MLSPEEALSASWKQSTDKPRTNRLAREGKWCLHNAHVHRSIPEVLPLRGRVQPGDQPAVDRAGGLHAASLRPRHDEPQPGDAGHAHRVHRGGPGRDGRAGLHPLSASGARRGCARQGARSHRAARDAARAESAHAQQCPACAAGCVHPAGVSRRHPDPGALRHPVDSGLRHRHQLCSIRCWAWLPWSVR